ncbi:MAG: hypothetical protein ABI615_13545 [Chthoniobacterales bacterium]
MSIFENIPAKGKTDAHLSCDNLTLDVTHSNLQWKLEGSILERTLACHTAVSNWQQLRVLGSDNQILAGQALFTPGEAKTFGAIRFADSYQIGEGKNSSPFLTLNFVIEEKLFDQLVAVRQELPGATFHLKFEDRQMTYRYQTSEFFENRVFDPAEKPVIRVKTLEIHFATHSITAEISG